MGYASRITHHDNPIIYFDGVCNLCNRYVTSLIKRDAKKVFKYAPLQSEWGRKAMARAGIDAGSYESVLLEEGERIHTKSSAVLRIARRLGALWPMLYIFIIIPKPLRDMLYDFIARNRYIWFGKRDACMVPTETMKDRFLKIS